MVDMLNDRIAAAVFDLEGVWLAPQHGRLRQQCGAREVQAAAFLSQTSRAKLIGGS